MEKTGNKVANFVVPLHFVTSTAALYVTPVYWIAQGRNPFVLRQLITHGGSFLLFLIDIALGAMYRFKIQYTLFAIVYFLAYVVFLYIRYALLRNDPSFFWPYQFLDFTIHTPGMQAGIYAILTAFLLFTSVILVLITRIIPQFVNREPKAKKQARESKV